MTFVCFQSAYTSYGFGIWGFVSILCVNSEHIYIEQLASSIVVSEVPTASWMINNLLFVTEVDELVFYPMEEIINIIIIIWMTFEPHKRKRNNECKKILDLKDFGTFRI